MPELPEVETVRRGLGPVLTGRRVREVLVRETRLRQTITADFAARLVGRRVERVDRRGKYLVATLDDGRIWLVHLGMTGRLTLTLPDGPPARHDHVIVDLDDGRRLTYHDPRRFGRMAILEASDAARETGSGLEPLAAEYTPEAVFALTRRRRTSIKALLMDQRRIAGLGNIYVNELLFRAGVRPRRRAAALTRDDCVRIVQATRAVLAAAIKAGGSSISDYRDGHGRPGWFQLRHQVYDRAGDPCRRCRTAIRSVVIVGRSSFYCPGCQR